MTGSSAAPCAPPTTSPPDVAACGKATLYTHSTVFVNDLPPFNEQVPYVAAVVDLEEGPRMMTQIIDCAVADLEIGMPLEMTFREVTDEVSIAVFRPAGA